MHSELLALSWLARFIARKSKTQDNSRKQNVCHVRSGGATRYDEKVCCVAVYSPDSNTAVYTMT